MMKPTIVYDTELNPNLFLFVGLDVETLKYYKFEISPRRDERDEFISFLKIVGNMIGFNNLAFDYPILDSFIKLYKRNLNGKDLVTALYNKGQEIIHTANKWKVIVKYPLIPQIDLFFINHYDNFAKATSLKILEFNMEMNNVETLPYPYDKFLTHEEIAKTVIYCYNDVNATYKFYLKNIDNISFRNRMSKIYKQNLINFNDVKIGGAVLLQALSNHLGISEYDISKMRTFRDSMKISDIILPYISFNSPQMQIFLEWWKEKTIYETKGQFSSLQSTDVEPLLPYCNNELTKGKLKTLNILIDGFQFDFGTGGLHGYSHSGVWKSDAKGDLILLDVSSYYPNLAAKNGFHPDHIPKDIFIAVILMLYNQRMNAREKGDKQMVKSIKLSLNGYLYGNSNSEYSFMYDPQFMMSICLNGQLLLVKLAEDIINLGIELIQVNTDGVLVKCPLEKKAQLDEIAKEWMKLTKLKLDYDLFDLIVQRDGNNYLGRFTDGTFKYKGAFDYQYAENGEWHKNFSMLIVAKGLEAYFVKGIKPRDFVMNHKEYHDFFKRTKYNKLTKLIVRTSEGDYQLQNVTRYYISKTGDDFIKIMKPLKGKTEDREFAVESGYKCIEMNKITDDKLRYMRQSLDYDYYIDKIQQDIDKIEEWIDPKDYTFVLVDDV